MEEIWKTIKGFENYQISNFGRIKSKKNGILKPQKNIYGYITIVLYKTDKYRKRKIKQFRIHRLVLEAFKPTKNMEKLEVNHKDKNRSNNNICNLEWCTRKENMKHCHNSINKYYNSIGCYDSNGKYFNSYREAAKYYNISPNTVKRDILGLTKRIERNRMTFFKDKPI